jgi:DNA-binding NarL/FixJ family response regulator
LRVLYVTGTEAEGPDTTAEQLSRVSPDLEIKAVPSAAQALQETRTRGGVRALVTSHRLASQEVLSVITTLRKDRIPMAVVPVLTDDQRDLFTSAVAAGADDVLLLRGETLIAARETLTRLIMTDGFRLRVLYAGADDQVWRLLEQVPFATAERAVAFTEGARPWRVSGAAASKLCCDVLVIDQQPNDVHSLHVLRAVRGDAPDLPVVVLVPSDQLEVETAAFDLGADEAIVKAGLYRRRLMSTLRRLHQRADVMAQYTQLRRREYRLRQLVETLPQSVGIIDEEFSISAMNAAAIALFAVSKPTDVVGRDFRTLVAPEDRDRMTDELTRIAAAGQGETTFRIGGEGDKPRQVALRGVMLERDFRGRQAMVAVFSTQTAVDEAAITERLEALTAERYETLAAEHTRQMRDLGDRHASELAAWDAQREDLERQLKDEDARREKLAASTEIDRSERQQAEATIGRLEEELRVAKRLGEVGSLAVAMAPEIHERVSAVRSAAELLEDSPALAGASRDAAHSAVAGAAKASTLVRQLVAFNRRQTSPPDRIDLSEAVSKLESTLPRLIGSHIDIETRLRPSGPVLQNGDDLDGLVIGLAMAGRDLLPLGGLLRIETDQLPRDVADLEAPADDRSGPSAVIAITAEGYGVTPAQMPPSVELLARRCGGSVRVGKDTSEATISVHLPVG